ncbi:DUF7500 family protein [Natrarchaeobius oligotrophus]|uniref:Flagella cluster protein n=1 Tax=Natrarchaeobius chitinivorans TaxID=1679083 RepID=A0A3N6MNR5_NATCH|nr:flagella cluster protein [Natrarchaeobius chitinivorans]RQG99160.1 flagella cluster protein [Natrarchaeobius chitinivorans]
MTDSNKETNPKQDADVPPVLPSEQPKGGAGGGALSPEDLDFTESPYVAEVSDGRYVVSADHSPPNVQHSRDRPAPQSGREPEQPTDRRGESAASNDERNEGDHQPIRSPEVARSVLADELERTDARFAIDIVSRFDESTVRHRTTSDDPVGTFNNLVLWYAQHVATETPTQRTATLLLAKSEFSPPLSPSQVRRAARRHGLTRSSTIGELLEAIE